MEGWFLGCPLELAFFLFFFNLIGHFLFASSPDVPGSQAYYLSTSVSFLATALVPPHMIGLRPSPPYSLCSLPETAPVPDFRGYAAQPGQTQLQEFASGHLWQSQRRGSRVRKSWLLIG